MGGVDACKGYMHVLVHPLEILDIFKEQYYIKSIIGASPTLA